MNRDQTLVIDGRTVVIGAQDNLLEVIRSSGIDIPTFCYHSELSVYGACRLCFVDIEGRGLAAACSTRPEAGMVVRTSTSEIREMRKVAIELLLANHERSCTTCGKSNACRLRDIAHRLGVDKVRFRPTHRDIAADTSSPSLLRDAAKCVLCGDCVRMCNEIQSVGAIDFAHRGSDVMVLPAFGRSLAEVECVHCGQCAAVCPTGALQPASQIEAAWQALHDSGKTVVAQVAPAVRVALGELFGMPAGSLVIGQLVAALKHLGFDAVYDTSFAADMTVIEEGTEFLARKTKGEKLPQFTSCCPAWVAFAELHFPDLLPKLSSCRSPQQMFASVAKRMLPESFGITREQLVVVSIMPCTAKKFEARRDEFITDGSPDVDIVLTTQELGRMIEEAGLKLQNLRPESLDLSMGFKTGAGVIFGASGGVTEAVMRFAVERMTADTMSNLEFHELRGEDGVREAVLAVGEHTVRVAMVHGLRNARRVAERVRAGEAQYDLIEVMACPGGCVGGAGQPVSIDAATRGERARGLYDADKMLQLHKPQDNPYVRDCYETLLGEAGGGLAHELLHTRYHSRRRIADGGIDLLSSGEANPVRVRICLGTNCFVRDSQELLQAVLAAIEERGWENRVDVQATFCIERCGESPNVLVGDEHIPGASKDRVLRAIERALAESHAPLDERPTHAEAALS
ncbi:MAG TPA: [FeFe] hydrogenase, group A [Bacteroidota bacterium]|nr:[FeFe] hydrogenase, group A [Bacteroidota bacterium]